MAYNNLPYLKVQSGYSEYSQAKLHPFYHTDLKNTLENIV